jgi:hypothetical protein
VFSQGQIQIWPERNFTEGTGPPLDNARAIARTSVIGIVVEGRAKNREARTRAHFTPKR